MNIHELQIKYVDHPVKVTQWGGMMPTQVHATIGDYHLYYRARHGEWYINVAKDEDSAVLGSKNNPNVIYSEQGDDDTHGCVPQEVYAPIVDKAIDFTLLCVTMENMTPEDFRDALSDVIDDIINDSDT